MLTIRQYLRTLPKDELFKIFMNSNLSEIEYKLMCFSFIDKYLRDKTCLKLHVQKTKYHSILNSALIKVNFTIKKLEKVRILQ